MRLPFAATLFAAMLLVMTTVGGSGRLPPLSA
jgi:hypothetical protein